MSDVSTGVNPELLVLTTDVVAAYVSNNTISASEVPGLISKVHATLTQISAGPTADQVQRPEPAVPVKRSVTPDYIICLEDGKKLKMLKRHLRTRYNMTPEQYRERWNLPADYPMTAPNYAAHRSDCAKKLGLGRKSNKASATTR